MPTIEITKENIHTIIENNDIVILDFWASWCGPCVQFAPVFEAASNTHSDVVFGKINTEQQRELGAEFQVRSIPMITIFREKIMLYHQPGALPPEELENILGKVKELDMDDVRRQIAEAAQEATQDPSQSS